MISLKFNIINYSINISQLIFFIWVSWINNYWREKCTDNYLNINNNYEYQTWNLN